ncbi:WD40/YVTN/BNR-like repeat-containing protein [Tumebacillus flagellatus]|uniref:Photosynthesis system II assembly factor Ycf48/Hcf136-like domain-containing protein n=1 Tax=Tumebacillus flagellatus TaxID=1157490 RepID=A0A074LX29_9BACL|nr:hypothetical protein [Tumebacillus flagellatus]KEO85095.1 hypothetical protein EL26_00595 [Tumebacillus flagellatus]
MRRWKSACLLGLCLLILPASDAGAGPVKKPLTLQQAVEIGMKRAVQWSPKAKLAHAQSSDFPMERESGEGGKRRLWNEEFGVPGTTRHLRLTVEDGEIKAVHETEGEDSYVDDVGGHDSPEAWNRARAEDHLKPGTGVEVGYHYKLYADDQKQARLAVSGSDKQGRPVQVHFRLQDGRKLTVYRKELIGGGLYAGDKLSLGSTRGQLPTIYGVEFSPDDSRTILAWGDFSVAQDTHPFAKLSRDLGAHWTPIQLPGIVSRMWWQSPGCLYAGGVGTLWRSRDEGQSWEAVLAQEHQIKINADTHSSKIAFLSDDGVQVSRDEGRTWNRVEVPAEAKQVLFDTDGTLYVRGAKGIFRQRGGNWEKVPGKFMTKSGGRVITSKERDFSLTVQESSKTDGRKTFANPEGCLYAEAVFCAQDRLYAVCKNKLYTRTLQTGDTWQPLPLPDDGLLLDLAVGPHGELYYAFAPRLVWKEQS